MTRISRDQLSFSSGELSPLLRARKDYQRFQTGLAACVGFLPLRQGGVTRAPGTLFRGYTRDNARARLIPFEFARNDALVLEFTAGWMRVWRYGRPVTRADGAPYEMAHPYGDGDLDGLQWVQSADVIYLADGKRPIQRLSRRALNDWAIVAADIRGGPFRVQNLDESLTIGSDAVVGTATLTASGPLFKAGHVGSLIRIEAEHYTEIPLWTGQTKLLIGTKVRNDGRIYRLVRPDDGSDQAANRITVGSRVFLTGTSNGVKTDTGVNPPVHRSGIEKVQDEPGVYWQLLGDGVGVARITAVSSSTRATATVLKRLPESIPTDPTYRWSEGAWSNLYGYPRCLEIHDQRLVAASTPGEPRTVWFSAIGAFEDFTPGVEADDAFAYAVSGAGSQNRVIWLKAGRGGLHIGALGEEYSARAEKGQAIGPTNAYFGADSSIGSKEGVRPIAPDGRPIFISKDGSRVLEIAYDLQSDANRAAELSLPAEHLGAEGFEEIVWQSAPLRMAWLRRGGGDMAVMVYDPSEEVLGWARCPVAGGKVQAMAVTADAAGMRDILTLVVERQVAGRTVRMVEEQAQNWAVLSGAQPVSQAVHLFASKVIKGPMSAFSIPHLAGRTIHVWTDQGEFGPLTAGPTGTVALPVRVGLAVAGLLDESGVLETLPIQPEAPDGTARARRKRLMPQSAITLHHTAALRAAAVEIETGRPDRQWQPVSVLPRPVAAILDQACSGTVRAPLTCGYAQDVAIRLWPVGGAPATVLAITPIISEAGL